MPEPIPSTQWKCNICNSKYSTEESATSCENSHIKYQEENAISNPKYASNDKYPYRITITMKDDTTHDYKIME